MLPDVDSAVSYARTRLDTELSPHLHYHRAAHTVDDVVPAVERLAEGEEIRGRNRALLVTAAWFHDLGFVERADGHELIGVGIALAVLPALGYDDTDLHTLRGLILATTVPQRPTTMLERLLCDADLDVLGRADFFERNDALRSELAEAGMSTTTARWYRTQADFVGNHRYFTATARHTRDAGKAANWRELLRRADVAEGQTR